MKIAINAHLLSSPSLRGWNRYTVNLIKGLLQQNVDLSLYSNHVIHPSHLAQFGEIRVVVSPPMRYTIWEQRWLGHQCAVDNVDVLHSPYNYGLPFRCPCARVLTLHDAIPQAFGLNEQSVGARVKPAALMSRLRHWIARQVADRIITVSEFSKRDIVRLLDVDPSRIDVIYGAADDRFAAPIPAATREEVRRKYNLVRPYIFYIGGWEERKNVPFLVEAFAAAKLEREELVLAGGNAIEQNTMKEFVRKCGIENRVKLLGWVDDHDLPSLYAEATCFVYPSLYEGFGLQICEAMAAGCAVFAADSTSLREILGEGGAVFSLERAETLALLLRRQALDSSYSEELRTRAAARSNHFSWRIAAEQTVATYDRAAEKRMAKA